MTQTVTVIYPTGSLPSGPDVTSNYQPYPKRLPLTISVEAGTPTSAKLERIFRMMNRVDGSPIEDQLNQLHVRSMCAGDMVEMDGLTFICEGAGWKYIMPSMGYVRVPPEGVIKARE